MDEISGDVIEGAVVKYVVEDAHSNIVAILFEKDGKNYKFYISIIGESHLIEVEK